LIESEPIKAFADALMHGLRPQIIRPDLGRHEQFLPGDAGRPDSFSHLALIAIHDRGVDMAVAKIDGGANGLHALLPGQTEGPEDYGRNALSLDGLVFHGIWISSFCGTGRTCGAASTTRLSNPSPPAAISSKNCLRMRGSQNRLICS